MPIIPPHPTRPPGEPLTVEFLNAQLRWLDWQDGYWNDSLHRRLIALEEAVVSRKARRRLRRQLRESAETFRWADSVFYGRRLEAVWNAYLVEMAEREGRSAA